MTGWQIAHFIGACVAAEEAARKAPMSHNPSMPRTVRSTPRPAPDIEAAIRLLAGWEPLGVSSDPAERNRRNPLIYAAQAYLDPH